MIGGYGQLSYGFNYYEPTGYPRDWENQEKWKGGRNLDGGELSLKNGSKLERVLKLFYHPEQPELKDYYETLISSKRKNHQPVARPRSLITQKRMEIKMGSKSAN